MIRNGEAGISCAHCGFEVLVRTAENAAELAKEFEWRQGNPVCKQCGQSCVFEDYLGDDAPPDNAELCGERSESERAPG